MKFITLTSSTSCQLYRHAQEDPEDSQNEDKKMFTNLSGDILKYFCTNNPYFVAGFDASYCRN
jgi:hypothetical protein